MSKINRGKQFEQAVKDAFDKECFILRLYDTTNGYIGIANPCDYIAYKQPRLYMIECKSCYGASLPLANITDNQYASLLDADFTQGIIAGFMIWFIDKDRTIFIRASDLDVYIKETGRKSIPWDIGKDYRDDRYSDIIDIAGTKKRIMWDYDMKGFLKHEWNLK